MNKPKTRTFFEKEFGIEENEYDHEAIKKAFRLSAAIFESTLINFLECLKDMPLLLEAGCGEGKYTELLLKENLNVKIAAIDFSLSGIKKARIKGYEYKSRVDFIICDMEFLPFHREIFDGLLALDVIHHLPSFKAIKEFSRVVKKNGFIFASEIVFENPFIFTAKKLFPFIPKIIKKSYQLSEEYPQTLQFTANVLVHQFASQSFKVIKKERMYLFVFILNYLKTIPIIRSLIKFPVLMALYKIEGILIKKTFFHHFCHGINIHCLKEA